ncbi:MAG: VOC family protein [Comamonadaceae bacterium]|nr:VOC family protein [Comamonadaceae bacterium]
MVPTTFSHVGLTCKDPIAIERFYTKYFGFRRVRVYAPGPDQVVVIRSGALAFEIFKATEESPIPAPLKSGYEFPGYRHICFDVNDLDSKLIELGEDAKPMLGPVDMGQFITGMRVCWLADPEGNIFELNQGFVEEDSPPPLD